MHSAAEAKKYEAKYILQFNTLGYYSSCRVLLAAACVSINLENPSDMGLKAAFEKKMAELGGVFSKQRKNYEFPSSDETFITVANELFRQFSIERKYWLQASESDKDRIRKQIR